MDAADRVKRARAGSERFGYVQILTAAVLWATLGPVARFALDEGVDAIELGFWRALIGGGLFGLHALAAGRLRIEPGDRAAVAGFGLVAVALFSAAYFLAVETGGAALAAVLLYTAPAWVVLASAVWLAEPLTPRKLSAVTLTMAGVALVALAGGTTVRITAAAVVWGLLSGLAYASFYLFGKRYFGRYDSATIFLYAMPLGAAVLAPLVDWSAKSGLAWAVIAYLAVVPTYLAYLVYSRGLERTEAGRAATVATVEPVAAAALAYMVWGETLGWWGYAGAVLVVSGVLVTTTARGEPATPHEGPADIPAE